MWTALPEMMVPRSNHSLAVVQGRRLVVMAGWGWEKTSRWRGETGRLA